MEITNIYYAHAALKEKISYDVEELWAIALGPGKKLIQNQMIFRGTVDSCLVHPRDIFRFAFFNNASTLIIAHSHPSGDLQASSEDIAFTKRLVKASLVFEIPILDHLICTRSGFSSFARERWCRFKSTEQTFLMAPDGHLINRDSEKELSRPPQFHHCEP